MKIRAQDFIIVLIIIAPILLLFRYLGFFLTGQLFHDDFDLLFLIHHFHQEGISFQDLFSSHNGHRLFIPKLIFWGLFEVQLWPGLSIFVLHLGFAFLTAIGLFILHLRLKKLSNSLPLLPLACTMVLLFSIVQYQNWLWGFQFPWFLINLLFVGILLLLSTPTIKWYSFIMAIVAAIAASLTSAHGLLVWFAVYPLLFYNAFQRRIYLLYLLVWSVGCIVTLSLYSSGLSEKTLWLQAIQNPKETLHFIAMLIGNPFSDHADHATVIGCFGLLSFLLLSTYVIRTKELVQETIVWSSLNFYTIGFAGLSAVGLYRIPDEIFVFKAKESRYSTVAILFWIGLIALAWFWSQRRNRQSSHKKWWGTKGKTIILWFWVILLAIRLSDHMNRAMKPPVFYHAAKANTCIRFGNLQEHFSCIQSGFIALEARKEVFFPNLKQLEAEGRFVLSATPIFDKTTKFYGELSKVSIRETLIHLEGESLSYGYTPIVTYRNQVIAIGQFEEKQHWTQLFLPNEQYFRWAITVPQLQINEKEPLEIWLPGKNGEIIHLLGKYPL